MLREGSRVALLSLGGRLAAAMQAAERLEGKGVSTTVADARFAKPLDRDLILSLARHHEALVTVEEGAVGGFGSHVLSLLANEGVLDRGLAVRAMTLPDWFIEQDAPEAMYSAAGLDSEAIEAEAMQALKLRDQGLAA